MPGTDRAYLPGGVGRRIFLLFVVATIVPIAVMAALTYRGVDALLTRESQDLLVAYSKDYGMGFIARLQTAQANLAGLSRAGQGPATAPNKLPAAGIDDTPAVFDAIVVFGYRTAPRILATAPGFSARSIGATIAHANDAVLADGDMRLVEFAGDDAGVRRMALVGERHDAAGAATRFIGVLNPDYVFGSAEALPAHTDLCVFRENNRTPLHCSRPGIGPREAPDAVAAPSRAVARSPAPDQGEWTLYPTTRLKFAPITFVSLRAGGSAFSGHEMTITYIELGAVCLTLALLLSLTQIRRILVPLDRLVEATRRVAAGDFSAPIRVEREDEFARLARAFNDMSRQLAGQISAIQTLAAIDHEILSGLDVDRIATKVLLQLRQVIPDCPVALVRLPSEATVHTGVPVWQLNGSALEKRTLTIGREDEAILRGIDSRGAHFTALDASGPIARLADAHGAARQCIVPVTGRDGSSTLVIIGLRDTPSPQEHAVEMVRELGKRLGVAFDAADREQRLLSEARQDSLTGLPNRMGIHEVIDKRIAAAEGGGPGLALLYIDLDRFKGVNDGLGHSAGDALLIEAARRIRARLRPDDTVARLGGDEFIVLTTAQESETGPDGLADRIIKALSEKFRIGAVEAHVGASIGIAHFPADGVTREDLLRNADTAMYRAKEGGRGCAVAFRESMGRAAFERHSLESDLRNALKQGHVRAHFQPRVRLSDAVPVGAEALARWRHPVRGSVAPDKFICLAEEIGLIEALGEDIAAQSCRFLADRKAQGLAVLPISVNLSPRQLQNPEVCQRLIQIVRNARIDPAMIDLEITESALSGDLASTRSRLVTLRDAGFRIALDDFGTGYSSLSHLQSLPINVMKIDKSFVAGIETAADSRAIAIAIITLAHSLGMEVVAEGVETPGQVAMLRDWKCDEAQGFFYSRPLCPQDFERYLDAAHIDLAAVG